VSPDTQKNLTLAALLGLVLGGGLVYLRERLDTHLRAPEDVKALGRRVIGVVPAMDRLIEEEFDGAEEVDIDGHQVHTSLIMLTSPMSATAEAYRRLRANLRFARPDANLNSMVITSASQGEGKTTTSSNLALSMASAGQKTLLIDADLRRPRLHKYFDMPRTPGLAEALYDGPSPLEAMRTAIDNLYVLSAGEELPNPAEVLGSQRMRHFIEEMEKEFDLVIVDTPPVLLFSDPAAVVTHTDGVLLVAAANQTDGRAFKHAASLLDDVEAAHVGVVLNRFRADQQRYGYGYGYNYGYEYGHAYNYGADAQLRRYYGSERQTSDDASAFTRWWKRSS
jgi:capsular exopolysaccharide synthesis family protein